MSGWVLAKINFSFESAPFGPRNPSGPILWPKLEETTNYLILGNFFG